MSARSCHVDGQEFLNITQNRTVRYGTHHAPTAQSPAQLSLFSPDGTSRH